MASHDNFYTKSLYPFQDGVLNIVKKSKLPFYLTGGTALSRGYFNHRYSDDLDFFINNSPEYPSFVIRLIEELEKLEFSNFLKIDKKKFRRAHHFTQIFVNSNDGNVSLKIDLINDIPIHFGKLKIAPQLGKIDNWRNILSNKLAALYRYEPKDVADIWSISRNKRFSWKTVLDEAKEKDAGLEPLAIVEIIKTFPREKFDMIKWVTRPDEQLFQSNLSKIGDDIFQGRSNSLVVSGE
jgi:hypothetical protein